jgi:hypothetical protein
MEISQPHGKTERYIGCDLLRKHPGHGWGYKDLTESMHPYYYTCPLSYLETVPVACEEWREQVREYHDKKRKSKRKETQPCNAQAARTSPLK